MSQGPNPDEVQPIFYAFASTSSIHDVTSSAAARQRRAEFLGLIPSQSGSQSRGRTRTTSAARTRPRRVVAVPRARQKASPYLRLDSCGKDHGEWVLLIVVPLLLFVTDDYRETT